MAQHNHRGFTLIELSITIIIIGLIVASISGGQILIEQAKLRKVATDFNRINVMIRSFQSEYNALPGDLANAYDYWGPECGENYVSHGFGQRDACNGNGNNIIESREGSGQGNWFETRMAWRHLNGAGYIDKVYTDPKVSTLNSPYKTAVYSINTIGITRGWEHIGVGYFGRSSTIATRKGHFVSLGNVGSTNYPADASYAADITPQMAKAIDVKIDDGHASQGRMLTMKGRGQTTGLCGPELQGNGSVTNYVLTDTTESCRISYEIQ